MKLFKELYQYREFLKTSIRKEFRGKYKKSFLGVLWSFINPLLQLLVYALVFPFIMRVQVENYTMFLVVTLIPWNFFNATVCQSTSTIIASSGIIKKVYFPREIIPISVVTAETVNFLISTIIILGFVIFNGLGISKYILFYPIILIAQYLIILAIAFIISSVCVYLRDLQHFIGIALQLLFYAAPIVYSPSSIPENYQWILKYNPMTYIINAYRDIFYNQTMIDLKHILIVLGIGAVGCVVGYFIFSKLQKGFAEQL